MKAGPTAPRSFGLRGSMQPEFGGLPGPLPLESGQGTFVLKPAVQTTAETRRCRETAGIKHDVLSFLPSPAGQQKYGYTAFERREPTVLKSRRLAVLTRSSPCLSVSAVAFAAVFRFIPPQLAKSGRPNRSPWPEAFLGSFGGLRVKSFPNSGSGCPSIAAPGIDHCCLAVAVKLVLSVV